MTEVQLLPVLTTALLAGLLGSGHCFGMCGGIAGSLGALGGVKPRGHAVLAAATFNMGRLLSYGVLGGLAALLLAGVGEALAVPAWGRWLRLLTAILIGMVGLQFLLGWRLLDFLEQAGGRVWAHVSPLAVRAAARPGMVGRMALGMCWGLLPCGLVYTLLLTAASTGAFATGFLVMLVFGLGTLPAMLGLTLAVPTLSALLAERRTRRIIGLALLLLASWSAVLALPGPGHIHGP